MCHELAAVIDRSKRERERLALYGCGKICWLRKFRDSGQFSASDREHSLPSIIEDASQRHQIVFVNGVWRPELSHLGAFAGRRYARRRENEYRLTLEGADMPCHLADRTGVSDRLPMRRSKPRRSLHIELARSGSLTLIEHHVAIERQTRSWPQIIDTEIRLGAQSKLVHGKIVTRRTVAMRIWPRRKVRVAEGAYYGNFSLIKGRALTRNEIEVTLEGKLAQCALKRRDAFARARSCRYDNAHRPCSTARHQPPGL